jgi:metabotropic X receptor
MVESHWCVVSRQAFEELETLLAKHNVCIAVKEKLVKDSGVADESAYDIIVQKLQTKPRARGEFTYFVVTGNYTQVSL